LNPELSFDSYSRVYLLTGQTNKKKKIPCLLNFKLNIILNNGRLEMKAPFSHPFSIALLEQDNKTISDFEIKERY